MSFEKFLVRQESLECAKLLTILEVNNLCNSRESTTELKRTFSMRGQSKKNKSSPKNNNTRSDKTNGPEDSTDSAPKLESGSETKEDANKISVFDERM